MTASITEGAFQTKVRKGGRRMVWLGAALLVIGVVALVYPEVATIAATLFVGWTLIFSGAAMLFGSFSMKGAGPFFGSLLLGLLSVGAGVFILFRPLTGAAAITITLGALFMIQGAAELALAFELRPARGWVWVLLSALASIVLSLVIITGWPGSSVIALGILLGVNFLTSGLAYVLLGMGARKATA